MTSIDYDPKDEKTVEFFKIVQKQASLGGIESDSSGAGL